MAPPNAVGPVNPSTGSGGLALLQPSSMLVVFPKSSSGKPTVGASNDNLEAVPPLTLVPRLLSNNRRAPESALEIRQTCRVRAVLGIRVE